MHEAGFQSALKGFAHIPSLCEHLYFVSWNLYVKI